MRMKRRVISAVVLTSLVLATLASSNVSGDYEVGWNEPFLVEDYDLHSAWDSACDMNENGDVVAAWIQSNGSGPSVWARLYLVGEGWTEAELVEDTSAEVRYPEVAIDEDGNAVVLWSQMNASFVSLDLWSNRFVRGVGWAGSEPIGEDGTASDYGHGAVMTDDGAIVAVWTHWAIPRRVMVSEFEEGVGWSAPSVLDEASSATSAYAASMDSDDEGNIIVVWCESYSGDDTLWSKRYDASIGWGDAQQIAEHSSYSEPRVAVGGSGDAMCVWHHKEDLLSQYEVRAVAYDADTGWEDETLVSMSGLADNEDPRAGVDAEGNALVVWWRQGALGDDGVYYMSYDAVDGWGDESWLVPCDLDKIPSPDVVMSDTGTALMLFLHDDGFYDDVRAAVYEHGNGWGSSEQLNEDTLGSVGDMSVAMDGDGNGFAIWAQSDSGKSDIWGARYSAVDDTPPPISIESPEDGGSFETSVIAVTGSTEPGASLVINGMVVSVEVDGSYSCKVLLTEGSNYIVATATDPAGNWASASVTVTYEPGDDALQDDLEEALEELNETAADLDEAMAELNQTRDDLAGAQEDIDDANDRIDSLSSQMLMVGAVAALFAVISAVTLLLYLGLRKRMIGAGGGSAEREVPPPPE
jgi:exonuclease VII small subunit